MKKNFKILHVEDSLDDSELVLLEFRRRGYEPAYKRVDTEEKLVEALQEEEWDLALCDYNMPQFSGVMAFGILRGHDPDLPIICVSGMIGEEVAVQAMRLGIQDYFLKHNLTRLIPAVEREIGESKNRRAARIAGEGLKQSEEILATILNMDKEAIISTDTQGRIRLFNQGAETIFGYTRNEMVGKSIETLIPERFHAAHKQHLGKFSAERTDSRKMAEHSTIFGLRKNGEEFPAEAFISKSSLHGSEILTVLLRDLSQHQTGNPGETDRVRVGAPN